MSDNAFIVYCYAVIDCEAVEDNRQHVLDATIDYVNETTTYESLVEITCDAGRVALGHTMWTCDKHGRWTKPRNFVCAGKIVF